MPARGLDLRTLRGTEASRVAALLDARPILAEPTGSGGVIAWGSLVVLGGLLLALANWRDWGVVTTWQSIGVLGWTAYAIGGALLARGVLGARDSLRRPPAPFKGGRFLLPCGFVDSRGPVLRVLPMADFESATVTVRGGDQLDLQVIDVAFAGGAVERFHIATNRGAPPPPKLAELVATRDAELDELVPEGTPPPKPRGSKRRAWLIAAGVGLAVQLAAYAWLLPSKSIEVAQAWHSPEGWTAVETAFPFAWVHDRAIAATAVVYADARSHLRARIHGPATLDALMAAVDALEAQHTTVIGVSAYFDDPAEIQAATARLHEQAGSGSDVSTVLLHAIDDTLVIRQLGPILDGTGLTLDRAVADRDPVLRVAVHVHATSAFRFKEERTYVLLTLDLDAVLSAAGKTYPASGRAQVPEPTQVSVSRLKFEGDPRRPLSDIDDPLVYQQMFDSQLELGLAELERQMLGP